MFPDTEQELLSQARATSDGDARQAAFEEICRRYWKPVYAVLRTWWAKSNEDAKDLAQAFFLWLFERDGLRGYDPGRGSFRPYLKSILRHFVQHREAERGRLKRGGGVTLVPLDAALPVPEDLLPDPRSTTPEEGFDQAWRDALLADVIARVRARMEKGGHAVKFRVFEAYDMAPPGDRPSYKELAERLGLTEGDVTYHLHTVRTEIRRGIQDQLREATSGSEELKEEWDAFFS